MKRTLIFLCCFAVLFAAGCGRQPLNPADADAVPAPDDTEASAPISVGMVVDTNVVNIRLAPSVESRVLDTAKCGAFFEITGKTADEAWYQVLYRGDQAYISADYLFPYAWRLTDTLTLATIQGESSVNIRTAAEADASVAFSAQPGARFLVRDDARTDGWTEIDLRGAAAFVRNEYLEQNRRTVSEALQY